MYSIYSLTHWLVKVLMPPARQVNVQLSLSPRQQNYLIVLRHTVYIYIIHFLFLPFSLFRVLIRFWLLFRYSRGDRSFLFLLHALIYCPPI